MAVRRQMVKTNVSVVFVCSAPNCCDTEQRSASQPGSVASGTHCIIHYNSNTHRTVMISAAELEMWDLVK